MRNVHLAWAWFVMVSNALAGSWALGCHWFPAVRHPALWWAVAVAYGSVFVQVVLGVAVLAQGIEAPPFHVFYGVVALVTVGIIVAYRSALAHRIYLLFGFGGLFLMGLAIRAFVLA